MQFFNKTEAILNFFLLQGDKKLICGFLCLYRPDFDRITILETFIIKKWRYFWTYISAILDFYDMYQFETYINGFLDLEYPNFDPKHGILSSVEAEIISFFQRRQPFAFSAFYVHPLTFEGGSPSKFDK